MGRNNKSQRRTKSNQKKPNTQKTPTTPTYNFEYDRFREAIVEANRIIREEEELANRQALREDHLTNLLVEFLRILFALAMIVQGILVIVTVVLSFIYAFTSESNIIKITCVTCWIAYAGGFLAFLLVGHLQKKGKFPNGFWFNFIICTASVFVVGSLIAALLLSEQLFITMSLTVIWSILFSFCFLAMRSLRQENDRAYLVSYFSAITGIAALVVSAITLIVTIFQKS